MNNHSEADLLDQTADFIAERGWCQNTLIDARTGAVCAVGAITAVSDRLLQQDLVGARKNILINLVKDYLDENTDYQYISQWNDEPHRTQGEVEDMFRTVAKELRDKNRCVSYL